jgi:AraC-like DNA-binding protein
MKNLDVRKYAKNNGVNLWEISEMLGYAHESAFSRVLRHELPEEKKAEIFKIIDELAAE